MVSSAFAAAGDPDATFGASGVRTDDLTNPYDDSGHGVAVQPDGKFIVVGGGTPAAGYGAFTLTRFTAAGALDSTFGGGDGIVVQATGVDGGASSIALQPDGKIVVGGTYWSRTGAAMEMFSFMRFNADGTLDSSFGGDGEAQIALGSWGDYMQAIAVQPDGKIVGTGISTTGTAGVPGYATARMGTVRIQADGTPDPLFGNNGVVITSIAGNFNKSRAVVIQTDGKIVIGGDLNNPDDGFDDFALVRYTTSGALDPAFSGDGMQIVKFNALHDSIHALALQPDGKILAGGFANTEQQFAIARLTTAGDLDTSFNTTGKVTTTIAGTTDAGGINSLDVQQNGRIVAAGFANNATRFTFALARYTTTGALDTTFSSDGMTTTDVGGSGANGTGWNCDQTAPECPGAHGSGILNDGKIVAAGARNNGTYNDTYTARYQGDTTSVPTVTISAPSGNVGSSVTPTFTTTTPGGVALAQTTCQIDANLPYSCTSGSAAQTGLAPGAHTLIVRVTDRTGISGSDTQSFTTVALPTVTISSPAEAAVVAATGATATFSVSSTLTATVTCQIDTGTVITSCVSPRALGTLAPGPHTFTVNATNASGTTTVVRNVSVADGVAPSVPTSISASGITTTGATINWLPSTDNVAVTGYDVYRGGTLVASTTGAVTYAMTGLTCGTSYSIQVRAKDAANNTSALSTAFTLNTANCSAPSVAISSPLAGAVLPGATTSVTVNFTLSGTAPTSTTCKLDNLVAVACDSSSSHTFTGVGQGPHTIVVTGNHTTWGNGSASVAFSIVDTVDPSIPNKSSFTLTNVTRTSATLGWPAQTDNVGVVRYYVYNSVTALGYGETFATDPNPLQLNITGLTCGTSTWIRLAAEDAAGHWGLSDAFEIVTLPCPAAPAVAITAPTNNSTIGGNSTSLTFTATQEPTSITCQLDAGAASACTSPQAYTALAPGLHTAVVSATNALGTGSATVSFTVPDNEIPTAPGAPAITAITTTTATATWTPSVDNVGVTAYDVYLNGTLKGSTAANSLPLTALTCNTHYNVTVRAKDGSGNTSPISTSTGFDTAACPGPTVTINTPTAGQELPGTTTAVAVTFTVANGPATSTTCRLDGGTAVACISGQTFAIAAQGPHTLQVSVTNVNGTNQAVVNFSVADTIDPATPNKATFTTTNRTLTSATLNWPTISDNVGVVRYYVYNSDTSLPIGETSVSDPNPLQLNINGLTCGTSTWIRLAAIDAADHWGTSDAYEITTLPCPTAPVVTITAPVNGSTLAGYSTSVAFTVTQNPTSVTCKLDAAATTACTSPQAYSSLTPGAHTVTVAATNALGSASQAVNFTVPDITAPTAAGLPSVSAITNAGATLNWSAATDNVAVTAYEVYVGGTLRTTTAATTFAVTGLACNTTYSAYVRAKDAAGNGTDSPAASFQTSVCPGPSVTITSPTAAQVLPGTTTSVAPTFTVANGPATTTTCKLDAAAPVPCISGQTFAIAAQGPHTLQVSVTNVNGSNQAVVNFSVADTIDPATPDKAAFTTTNRTLTSATLNWPAITDNVGVVRYFIYDSDTSLAIGETLATDPNPLLLNITGLTCGTSTWIRLAAIDAADHWGVSDAYEVTTLPCPTAPIVTISAPVNGSTLAGYGTSVAFTATQDPTSITCKLDAAAAAACTSPQAYAALAPGAHSVTVTATNGQGSGAATVNFTVPDITAPTAPGVPSAGSITASGATLSWVGSTDNVGVTAYDVYAGGTLRGTTAATTFPLTGLACNTTFPIYIKAKDAAGNTTDSAAGSFQTSVCPGPTVTITAPTPAQVFAGTTTSVAVGFTIANGPATTTTCKLDAAAAVPCTTGQSFAIAAQGPHTLQVTVSNVNGTNSQAVSFSVTDTVDPATPDKTLFTTTNRALTSATLNWPAITDNVGVVSYYVYNSDTSASIGETLATDPNPLQLNITGLTCGTSTWIRLAAIDAAGHWGVSDAYEVTTLPCPTAPVVTITSPVNGTALAGYTTSVAFTATQDPTSVTCKLDAAAAAACTSPQAYAALTPGAHTVTVTATNAQGATAQAVNFTVPDITAPTTPGTPAISNITPSSATASWVTSTDNVDVTAYDVYVGATLKGSTTGATTFALTGLTCGASQSITVRARDAAGNTSAASPAAVFSTSTCPGPVATITSPTAGQVFAGTTTSITASFTVANGPSTTTTCKLDAAAAVPCTSGQTIAIAVQGPHILQVTVSNVNGTNTAVVNFSVTDTIDPATPDKTLFTTTNRTLTSATLNWPAITDNVGVVRYYVYNSDTSASIGEKLVTDPNPLQLDITGLACGTSTWIRLAAIDAAEHWGVSDAYEVTTLPCPTAPVVTITAPVNGSTLAGYSTSVAFTATQDPTSITCKLDSASPAACTSPQAYAALAPGSHTVTVTATNPQGATAQAVTFTVPDITAPTTPGTPTISAITPTSATATWAASTDNVAVTAYDVYVGGTLKGSTTGATTFALTGLTCGSAQSVTIRARDAATNTSTASAAAAFNTSTCPGPVATITAPVAGVELPDTTTSVTVNFTLATSGEAVTTTCKLDNQPAATCATGTIFNALGQGPHTISVTANSIYGSNTAVVNFAIEDSLDPSKPAPTVSDITRTSAKINWTAQTDNVGVALYRVLDVDWNVLATKLVTDPDPLSWTMTGLTCGTTTYVRVIAADAAEHWGTSDLVAVTTAPCLTIPVVTISSPAEGASFPGGALSVAFTATQEATSFTCKLDAAAPEVCTSPKSYSGLGEGPHTILVSATNTTGTGTKALTVSVPDVTPPTAPTGLATSAVTGTAATLTWTAGTDNVAVTGYDIYNGATKLGSSVTTSFAVTGLTCGTSYTLTVKSKDAAALESPASAGHTFTSGACNVPTVSITSPTPDQSFATGSFNVAFLASGAGTISSTTCKIDALAPVACVNNQAFNGLAQGPHTLLVSVTSEWGTGTASVNFSVKDTVAPTAPTNLTTGVRTLTSVTVSWTASTDNVAVGGYGLKDPVTDEYLGYTTGTQITLTGSLLNPWQCGTSHWVRVIAEDVELPTHNYTSSNDLQVATLPCLAPPTVNVTAPANSATPLPTNSFVLAATVTGNPTPTLKCSLDNQPAETCVAGQVFSNLAYGSHSLTVTATNDQGVASQTVNFVSPDAIAPSKPVGLGHTATTQTGATVNWTASTDNVGVTGYDVYVGGSLKGSTAGLSLALTGLTCATAYDVTVQAKDARGNLSQFSDAHSLTTADCSPPEITTASANVTGRNAAVSFTVTGQTTSVTCKLDAAAAAACTSPKLYSNLSAGNHSVLITAAHTTWGTDTETVNFTVLDLPPSAPFNAAATGVSKTGFTITWAASNDDFGIDGYDVWMDDVKLGSTSAVTLSYAVTGLTCGTEHAVVIRARDTVAQTKDSEPVFIATLPCVTPPSTGGGGGGGEGTPPPTLASITSIPKSVKLGKAATIGFSCPTVCTVTLSVKIGKKTVKLPSVKLASGQPTLKLKASKSVTKKIKAGLKKKQKVIVSITPTTSAGKGETKTLQIK